MSESSSKQKLRYVLVTIALVIAILLWKSDDWFGKNQLSEEIPKAKSNSATSKELQFEAVVTEWEQKFDKAKALVHDDPAQAREIIEVLLENTDKSNAVLNLLSETYAEQDRRAKTIEEQANSCAAQVKQYAALAKIHPDWSELLYRLASQHLVLQRLKPEMMEELDAAVVELKHVVELAHQEGRIADEASGYFQLGRTYKHQGDTYRQTGDIDRVRETYRLAFEVFNKTLKLQPERIDALGETIQIRLAEGKAEDALRAAKTHLPRVEPPHLKAKMHEMLGALEGQLGNAKESEESFLKALEQNPKLMGSYLHLAAIYQARSDYESAEAILKRSVLEEPSFLEGHISLGAIFQGYNRFADAEYIYIQMLEIPKEHATFVGMLPSHALYRNNLYYQAAEGLAKVYFNQEKYDEALEAAQAAAQHQPLQAPLQDLIGKIIEQHQ